MQTGIDIFLFRPSVTTASVINHPNYGMGSAGYH
jgi:hypothetical protein